MIAEGRTEVGFLQHLLFRALNADPLDLGIRVSEGQGNRQTLDLLSALTSSGLLFAGLADNEGDNPVRWAGLKETMGATLLQWVEGCTEEAVITQIPDERLDEIIGGVDHERRGDRLRTLADRVGIIERDLQSINSALELMGKDIRTLIIEAASGSRDGAPEGDNGKWKSHGRVWFKSVEGGRELANQMIALGAWPALRPTVLPLLNAILSSVDIEPIDDLNP